MLVYRLMKGSIIKTHGADKFHYRHENYPEVFRVFFFFFDKAMSYSWAHQPLLSSQQQVPPRDSNKSSPLLSFLSCLCSMVPKTTVNLLKAWNFTIRLVI